MACSLTSLNDLSSAAFDTIIDVRAPSEFAEDHLPGAINLPVLSDEERARVGTVYKQISPFDARKIGAALVAKNAARHLEGSLAGKEGGWRPLLYCWRGGQRSGSFAAILAQIGWRVEVLDGGYRSYRRLVVDSLYQRAFPARVVLLDGNTGTAKTEVLGRLPALGVQVLDLEAMAEHRGSALGGHGPQPSQKAFETRLASAIDALDPSRPVVVEAESSRIGRINLPPRLFEMMRSAPRIQIDASVEDRASYLCTAYADLVDRPDLMVERLQRLVRLQGHERVKHWSGLAEAGERQQLAEELIRHHYDPRYARVRGEAGNASVTVSADDLTTNGITRLAKDVAVAVGRV